MTIIYEGTAPDGSTLRVGSRKIDVATAWMHISSHKGMSWYGNAVRKNPEDWTSPRDTVSEWIKCHRVT